MQGMHAVEGRVLPPSLQPRRGAPHTKGVVNAGVTMGKRQAKLTRRLPCQGPGQYQPAGIVDSHGAMCQRHP